MTKQEFLEELRKALTGEVPRSVMGEQLRFYDSYIDSQIRGGKREEEVLEELGSPRLIARTIIDSAKGGEERRQETSYSSGGYYEEHASGYSEPERPKRNPAVTLLLILILVLLLVICILGTMFRFLFSPFGLVFILCVLVYFWFAARRR